MISDKIEQPLLTTDGEIVGLGKCAEDKYTGAELFTPESAISISC